MNKNTLLALIAQHGLTLDGWHGGAGSFRDLEIGIGAPGPSLGALLDELRAAGVWCAMTHVDNRDHPDCGKAFLMVHSFWWE